MLITFLVGWAVLSTAALSLAGHRQVSRVAYVSPGVPMAPLWITAEAGYFREVGLKAEMLFIQASSTGIQSLLSGEIDYVMVGAAPVVMANLQGADIAMIATTIPTMIFSVVVAPEIQRIEDIKGKTLGFGRFGTNSDFAARLLLEKYQLTPGKDVFLVQTGGATASLAALRNGYVKAAVMTDVTMLDAKKFGFKELLAFKDLGFPFSHNGFAAKRSFLREHEAETVNFLHAASKGIYRMLTDREFSIRVIQKYSRLEDKGIIEGSYEAHAGRFLQKLPYTTPAMIQTVLRHLSETVPAAQNANPAHFFDNRYIQALEQKGLYRELDKKLKGG
ncbi:MAG: ABC transporter substrate-binding protein [Deltaproteobacteria bacterium]|nr:ABC transporter substrate-binding protein [Deltaproteobacteria bacterium]